MTSCVKRNVINVLKGSSISPPPIWVMRQAGRYIPEYKELRNKAKSFLDLCYTPSLAVEATLQPIRRFNFDAAILFSDILLIPHALGQKISFENDGLKIDPLNPSDIFSLDKKDLHKKLSPVYETTEILRKSLPEEKTLIGFAGAPWTLASYMVSGRSTFDSMEARLFSFQYPEAMKHLLTLLSECVAECLIEQIKAGADTVQIFDSWAGIAEGQSFDVSCIQPVKKIVKKIKNTYPNIPIIGFPRGAGNHYNSYRKDTGVDAISLDWTVSLDFAKTLQDEGPIQGNLDPVRLLCGGLALQKGIDAILTAFSNKPFLFNLGHGILPQTPIEHVHNMINQIRKPVC